jgi:hypothetical protein
LTSIIISACWDVGALTWDAGSNNAGRKWLAESPITKKKEVRYSGVLRQRTVLKNLFFSFNASALGTRMPPMERMVHSIIQYLSPIPSFPSERKTSRSYYAMTDTHAEMIKIGHRIV